MSAAAPFFEGERLRFFRPLSGSRRELVAACLRALFERLHGPAADYSHNLTRELLRELLLPVVREYQDRVSPDAGEDELSAPELDDPHQLVTALIRALLSDGWLEQFADRNGLVTAFRFSRPGSSSLKPSGHWTVRVVAVSATCVDAETPSRPHCLTEVTHTT